MAELTTKGIDVPELAALVDLAERPRADGWSLRAALVRYAQPEPMRVSRLLDLYRRLEFALAEHLAELRSDGEALWSALDADPAADEPHQVGMLRAMREIDRVGDDLAAWAARREGDRPDAAVDAVIDDLTTRLDELGVPEQGPPPPGFRGRG